MLVFKFSYYFARVSKNKYVRVSRTTIARNKVTHKVISFNKADIVWIYIASEFVYGLDSLIPKVGAYMAPDFVYEVKSLKPMVNAHIAPLFFYEGRCADTQIKRPGRYMCKIVLFST